MAKDLIKKDFGRAWEGIPPSARLIIYGIGAYAIYKGVQYAFSYVGGAIDKEEAKYKGQGQKPTLSNAEYMNLAGQIRAAKRFFNDDEAAIYSALMKLNNTIDFIELQKAFGIEEGGFLGDDMDLLDFLRDVLDARDEKTKANNILAQRNIPYRL
jgi:hypothetical protein